MNCENTKIMTENFTTEFKSFKKDKVLSYVRVSCKDFKTFSKIVEAINFKVIDV